MSNLLGKIFGGGAGDVVESIGSVADKFITTKKERDEFRNKLRKEMNRHEEALEKELSKRHKHDMNSDSWLSKNIRPLTLVFTLMLFTVLSFSDGNLGKFSVDDAYINMLKQMAMMVFGFYFGSRSLEKITQMIKNRKNG